MKKYIWILAALLLLAGCAAQPSDPTPTVPSEAIKPTGFTLNAGDMTFFNPGEVYDLKVRLVPADAEMPDVTWTSSDPNVASVSWNGRVTAISNGTVTITATIEGVGEQKCIFRCQFSGSATPAPTPTESPTPAWGPVAPDGLELDVGDGEHTFWIEITQGQEHGDIWVNIYRNKGDAEPFQQFEDHALSLYRASPHVVDADFDGNMDFYFERDWGSLPIFWNTYYIWDAEEEKFVPDPYGLNNIPSAQFNSYAQEVSTATRVRKYYQYKDGELTFARERFVPEEGEELKAYTARYVTVDEAHTFWVEVVDTGEFQYDTEFVEVNVYAHQGDAEPIQTFKNGYSPPYGLNCFLVQDVDFDGDMDFSFCTLEYRANHRFSHYIWDEEQEKFIEDPYGLYALNDPDFDEEKQVIMSSWREWVGQTITYYQYRKGALACIRSLYYDYFDDNAGTGMRLEVKDEINGELTTVFVDEIPLDELPEGKLWTEEFMRWFDLDYHGE